MLMTQMHQLMTEIVRVDQNNNNNNKDSTTRNLL